FCDRPRDTALVCHAEDNADFSCQNLLRHKSLNDTRISDIAKMPSLARVMTPMTTRFRFFCASLICIWSVSILTAQEEPQKTRLPLTAVSPTVSAVPEVALSSSATPTPPQLTDVLFKNLKARSIGPAVMGGRVSDIAISPNNPFVFYVGLAHGGVFKTNDNGVSFEPIFDKQPMLSIGAIAVAPSDSDVIWVGTGEANDRNSSGWGDGVYRSNERGDHIRWALCTTTHTMEFHVRSQRDGWRRCRGNFQEHRWWHDLEETWRRFTRSDRSHWFGDQRDQSEGGHGSSAKLRRRI